jgi:hypothetical protein
VLELSIHDTDQGVDARDVREAALRALSGRDEIVGFVALPDEDSF